MDFRTGLTIVDYVVVIVMFLIPLGIGVTFAYRDRKKATRDEYLLGGRNMSLFPITMSLFVTFQSAISLMGIPNEVYSFGAMYALVYIGISLSYIVGYFIMIPVMYPLKLTSIYEYLLLRYESQTVRMLSTIVGMFQTTFYMAIALFSPALALQTAASIPLWMSVVIVGVIGTIYTAIGGIKSVVWTDTFQTLIVFAGIFLVLVKGSIAVGGIAESISLAYDGGRMSFDVVNPDPRTRHSWWGTILGGLFMWLGIVFNQSTIQRVSSMGTIREAKICFLLNIPMTLVYGFSLMFTGIVMYAYFNYLQCDPLKGGLLTGLNQLLPYYVLHVLKELPGMPGFYMATLFSGGLSTISSGMNALAANTVEDLLKSRLASVKETTVTKITKCIVFIYGAVIVSLAYSASALQGPVTQMSGSVFGACGSPIFGMFIMGILFPFANKYGALTGGIVSLAINVTLAITGQLYGRRPVKLAPNSILNCPDSLNITSGIANFTNDYSSIINSSTNPTIATNISTDWSSTFTTSTEQQLIGKSPHDFGYFFFDISYEWYSVIGTVVCLSIGLVVSYLTRGWIKHPPNPDLLSTYSRRWCSAPVSSDIDLTKSKLPVTDGLTKSKLPVTDGLTKSKLPVTDGLTKSKLPVTDGLTKSKLPVTDGLTKSKLPVTDGLTKSPEKVNGKEHNDITKY